MGWLGLLRCCRSCLGRDASADRVGGELDPVRVAELLEHVLDVRRDRAARRRRGARRSAGWSAPRPPGSTTFSSVGVRLSHPKRTRRGWWRAWGSPSRALGRADTGDIRTSRRVARRSPPLRRAAGPRRSPPRSARGPSRRPRMPPPANTGGARAGGRRRPPAARQGRRSAARGNASANPRAVAVGPRRALRSSSSVTDTALGTSSAASASRTRSGPMALEAAWR